MKSKVDGQEELHVPEIQRVLKVPLVEKKPVVVALVPVALVQEKSVNEPIGPETMASVIVGLTKV